MTDHSRRTFLLGSGALLLAACASNDDASSNTTGAALTSAPPVTDVTEPSAAPSTIAEGPTTSDQDEPTASTAATEPIDGQAALTAAEFEALAVCTLLAESTAGPFGLDEQFDRSDITEEYPGHPVRLGLRVVDAECVPITDSRVEVWHTDATGDYSAFADNGSGKDEGQGTSFMRGTQPTNDDGIVEFATIYPGWYGGRTPHIHVRVHRNDSTVLTSQLYFDDAYTAAVYETGAYAEFGQADTTNASDGIAGTNPALLMLQPSETAAGTGTLALLNLGLA